MKLYSNPQIKKPKDDQWFIAFNYIVPEELRAYHKRGTERFKRYGDINMYEGEEREKNAQELCDDWKFALKNGLYNPFQEELDVLSYIELKEMQISMKETEIEETKKIETVKSEKDKRKEVSIYTAFLKFIESRKDRTENGNTISSYRVTIKWLSDYFEQKKMLMDPISVLDHLDINGAIIETKRIRKWENSTYNNEVTNAMTVFNWMAEEYYTYDNPSTGRIKKFKANKSTKNWYTREISKSLKEELLKNDCIPVYRASQFTYWICIRSKAEIMKLKVSDIDRTLKRVRFSADLSKDSVECYRDYPPEFESVLDDMELHKYPGHFYVFGRKGMPDERKCHKDFLAEQFRPVREALKLSDKYQIYTWKRTRVIHEMMKKTDPYQIQHMLRHDDIKTTLDYMKGFDISLVNVYGPEDLIF